MIIEIRKAGFVNKGAELMLLSLVEKLRARYPDAKLVMAPSRPDGNQPYIKIAQLGFYLKPWKWRFGIQWGDFTSLIPGRIRKSYGLYTDKEIDVVIDAAGFAYGDQWGVGGCKELARSSRRWKRRNTVFIMMPQALGPFKSQAVKPYVQKWVENADCIFARDSESLKYLSEVVGEMQKIKVAPDFTNLLEGQVPDYFSPDKHQVAIVPNCRMLDMTSKEDSQKYMPVMIECTKRVIKLGKKPFILVHEGDDDLKMAKSISEEVGGVEIIVESDALKIKGILGACHATVGSRFHGLVSALSQGVPSLATGWSHKYQKLFEDYGSESGVLRLSDDLDSIVERVDEIVIDNSNKEIKKRLMHHSTELKNLSEEMWNKVFQLIDSVDNK